MTQGTKLVSHLGVDDTEELPADCPQIATFVGSPPNLLICE